MLVCLHEALGTCMLFLAVNMTANQPYQVYAIGIVLMMNIVLIGPITNSHVNPAVTMGVLVRETAEKRSEGKMGHNFLFALRIMLS